MKKPTRETSAVNRAVSNDGPKKVTKTEQRAAVTQIRSMAISHKVSKGRALVTAGNTVCEDHIPYGVLQETDAKPLRFVDLFCGIGGFRLAFEGVG